MSLLARHVQESRSLAVTGKSTNDCISVAKIRVKLVSCAVSSMEKLFSKT